MHETATSPRLPDPVGYAHAVVAGPGRAVYLGGQVGAGRDGAIRGDTMVEQFDGAAANVVEALRAAGATPDDLVSMQVLVTDAAAYRDALAELGAVWRRHFGRWYPAMALLEVKGLFDPRALVELVAVAVVADGPPQA
ncbi:MAG: RidA family protein [Acidimicrobiales bacterium]